MLELQRQLSARFQGLRDSRPGPVYFIEHGLGADGVESLRREVGRALAIHPLASGWWNTHGLPLLVAATEVGYRYQGPGTDFWPVFEAEAGLSLGASDRHHLRDLFADEARIYRGAQPPVTPWTDAFHLIAWPITHALVPRDYHRPLALTLASLKANVAKLADGDLYRVVRFAASTSSGRFATFLEDEPLVVAVTRTLLGEEAGDLCPEVLGRVAADLSSDKVARRAIAVARRAQRGKPSSTRRPRSPELRHPGTLQLRKRDEQLSLEAVFPALDGDTGSKLRRTLRRRRFVPRLWGVSARVPSDRLLSGLPFRLDLTALPKENVLLPGLEDLDVDPRLKDILASFSLDAAPPLLFSVAADGEVGRRVIGPAISGHRNYWLLSTPGGGPLNCPALGVVGPYECRLLDPSEASGRTALVRLGFQARFGVSVAFAGSPPLYRGADLPQFAVGDMRCVVARRTQPGGLSVRLGDEQSVLGAGGVITLLVERGDHVLRVSTGEEEREFRFRGVSSPQVAGVPVCTVEARTDDLSVQALLGGALSFEIDSVAPLEGLELTVLVKAGVRTLATTAPLDLVPCSLRSDQEPFASLLDDEVRLMLTRAPAVSLTLRVGRLCSRSFTLTHRVRSCWWRREATLAPALTAEDGDLPFGAVSTSAPAAVPSQPVVFPPCEAQLLAPLDLDRSKYGGAAPFSTLCVAPTRASLDPPSVQKPRLLRRRRGARGSVGLEDVVESYLRWALAESASAIAELRRRQTLELLEGWMVEVCCGDEWARREAALAGTEPWGALERVCNHTGMGRDSYVELSKEDELEVTRISVREIRLEIPELWARVGPPHDLSPKDYEALDLACGRAYTELAGVYLQRGMAERAAEVEEGDPGAAKEDWDAVLERVKSMADIRPLAAMVLPTDSASELLRLDPSRMTLNELTEEVLAWAKGSKRALVGGTPRSEDLHAILALWTQPEVAVNLDWNAAIDLMLTERAVARAVRYLAFRSRVE